ncbi:hypothetical protein [Arabiibacter massiliensis]|uniref:hypothetical protein n=1 Tax=Arabiibacter massiliensis TaxID=1870985 RepID=UPI0009BC3115|nr:hypothetical protein [Arabiibacter massiliensis]
MSGKKSEEREGMPLWVVDGLVDTADAVGGLAQAIECATVAVDAERCDPGDFIEGTLDVLLLAAEDAYERLARLRDAAEGALA